MARVIVVGGGFGGCAAALTAAKAGVEVTLIEKMNRLSGLAPWTGHLSGWIARQEALLMDGGAGEIIQMLESLALHRWPELGVPSGSVCFDVTKVPEGCRKLLTESGVQILLQKRVVSVTVKERKVVSVVLQDGSQVYGDAFVDATGQMSGVEECERLGQGCVLCMLMCPLFGDRVSITEAAEAPDEKKERPSYMSCVLIATESLSPELRERIETSPSGYTYIDVPDHLQQYDFTEEWRYPSRPVTRKLGAKPIQIIHMPFAKTWLNVPTKFIRQIQGFENAWIVNPLVGGGGQPLRMGAVAPRDNTLRVSGLENLFAAGLKTGDIQGFVEVLFTGDLAGYNATRQALKMSPMELPSSTLTGFFINEAKNGMTPSDWPSDRKIDQRYYEKGLVTTDMWKIKARLGDGGMIGLYSKPLS
ncbi:MAG: FAD-dependent oxidoreductase [Chloroflexi bacterium]|nr:FAD-dependent oxidoreductase [Chloroflexota bacterium]